MSYLNKQILIITGPTGVGKTSFVLQLADKMSAEIINADIGQMYEPLSIGTAKPNWQQEPVPHHLFNILTQPIDFTVTSFREHVKTLIDDIWARGKTPMIVGGSTLYIKSLLFPPCGKSKLENNVVPISFEGIEDLWQELNKIDPVRAAKIHPNDIYRLERALTIWHQTGMQPSNYVPVFDPIVNNIKFFYLSRPRNILYDRINTRVDEMMDMGWIDEVANLSSDWKTFLRRKKIIGYEVVLDYLDQKIDFAECVSIIQKRVRNYAKRQQTFWRSLQKQIVLQNEGMHNKVFEVDLTSINIDLYIEQLLGELK